MENELVFNDLKPIFEFDLTDYIHFKVTATPAAEAAFRLSDTEHITNRIYEIIKSRYDTLLSICSNNELYVRINIHNILSSCIPGNLTVYNKFCIVRNSMVFNGYYTFCIDIIQEDNICLAKRALIAASNRFNSAIWTKKMLAQQMSLERERLLNFGKKNAFPSYYEMEDMYGPTEYIDKAFECFEMMYANFRWHDIQDIILDHSFAGKVYCNFIKRVENNPDNPIGFEDFVDMFYEAMTMGILHGDKFEGYGYEPEECPVEVIVARYYKKKHERKHFRKKK